MDVESQTNGDHELEDWSEPNEFETAWIKAQKKKPRRRAYGRATKKGGKKRGNDKISNDVPTFKLSPQRTTKEEAETIVPLSTFLGKVKTITHTTSSLTASSSGESFRASSSSSIGELDDPENINPNVITQEEDPSFESPSKAMLSPQLQLTSSSAHVKSRPRKIRHIQNVNNLASSFSELANEPPSDTWKLTTNDAAASMSRIDGLLGLTPDRSIATNTSSSRKRGVCDSLEDATSSGLTRRSRSRIFSPPHSHLARTTSVPMPVAVPSTSGAVVIDSDDEPAQQNEEDMHEKDSSEDEMLRSFDDDDDDDDEILPPATVRRSPVDFEKVIFAPRLDTNVDTDAVINGMSSYGDLKFLARNLRKERVGATMSSFGGRTSWTVGVPDSWSVERRTNLLHWATTKLGFSLRTGGASVTFLQISKSKGANVLKELEATLSVHKKQDESRTKLTAKPKAKKSKKKETTRKDEITGMILNVNSRKSSTFMSPLDPMSTRKRENFVSRNRVPDSGLDMDLLGAFETLGVQDANPIEAIVDETLHLEPEPEALIDNFDHIPETRPARHSGEHQAGGEFLSQHLYGTSPRVPTIRRRPKVALNVSTEASPFPSSGRHMSVAVDCLETPSVKRDLSSWGCQNTHDWGAEEGCSKDIINELLSRFEDVYATESEHLGDMNKSEGRFSGNLELDFQAEDEVSSDDEVSDPDHELGEDILALLPPSRQKFPRRQSVGATAMAGLSLGEGKAFQDQTKGLKRRMGSIAKHRRVSLCVSSNRERGSLLQERHLSFARSRTSGVFQEVAQLPCIASKPSFDFASTLPECPEDDAGEESSAIEEVLENVDLVKRTFCYLSEEELLCRTSVVSTTWTDISVEVHADLMLRSVGCEYGDIDTDDEASDCNNKDQDETSSQTAAWMDKPWKDIMTMYPWACFLSEGAFKKVFKVWNSYTQAEEAVSVMDIELIESTGNKQVIGAELAVSALLSSLVRRGVCPNFVATRRVFTCVYEPPSSHWGSEEDKRPKGGQYSPSKVSGRKPQEPCKKQRGRFQYMRMELCSEGDAEEYLKRQPDGLVSTREAASMLFQVAFALHAAADRFSLKHYDMKLLNVFLQSVENKGPGNTVLRYGVGSSVFSLSLPYDRALVAKVADYGTAVTTTKSNGAPATIGQFTTLENTPPEFLILGDAAEQGHGHDAFGLGLCMLHLFSGHAPYEEIMEEVTCPSNLKHRLSKVWADERSPGFTVIRSVILADVETDEEGNIVEGEPDEILYDTLYRYLVLFGVPSNKFKVKEFPDVWRAIKSCLEGNTNGKGRHQGTGNDKARFMRDRRKFSIEIGNNKFIARARARLQSVEGAMEALQSLVDFNPDTRARAIDLMNSQMMEMFREDLNTEYSSDDKVMSYMAYATK